MKGFTPHYQGGGGGLFRSTIFGLLDNDKDKEFEDWKKREDYKAQNQVLTAKELDEYSRPLDIAKTKELEDYRRKGEFLNQTAMKEHDLLNMFKADFTKDTGFPPDLNDPSINQLYQSWRAAKSEANLSGNKATTEENKLRIGRAGRSGLTEEATFPDLLSASIFKANTEKGLAEGANTRVPLTNLGEEYKLAHDIEGRKQDIARGNFMPLMPGNYLEMDTNNLLSVPQNIDPFQAMSMKQAGIPIPGISRQPFSTGTYPNGAPIIAPAKVNPLDKLLGYGAVGSPTKTQFSQQPLTGLSFGASGGWEPAGPSPVNAAQQPSPTNVQQPSTDPSYGMGLNLRVPNALTQWLRRQGILNPQ